MRIGVLSDVHANIHALEAVLEDCEARDPPIDTYVCLGDVVGYGADPNPCCEIVRDVCDFTVIGNHDAAVCGRMDYSFYYQQAREALDWHAEQTESQYREWMKSFDYREDREEAVFSHGSPVNLEEFDYVFNLQQANALIQDWDELGHVNFIGHSHLTKSFELDRGSGAEEIEPPLLEFDDDHKYVVTAGSIGQPRDNDNRACYGVYDTEESSFRFHRVRYDIRAAAQSIFDSELPTDFGKRLFFGI
ncbi:MAG: metallophosphoesterase [Bradymonadaceae bacterium]